MGLRMCLLQLASAWSLGRLRARRQVLAARVQQLELELVGELELEPRQRWRQCLQQEEQKQHHKSNQQQRQQQQQQQQRQ